MNSKEMASEISLPTRNLPDSTEDVDEDEQVRVNFGQNNARVKQPRKKNANRTHISRGNIITPTTNNTTTTTDG